MATGARRLLGAVGLLAACVWGFFTLVVVHRAFDDPLLDTDEKVIEAVIIALGVAGALWLGRGSLAALGDDPPPHPLRRVGIGLLLALLWFGGPYVLTLSARW